MSSRSQDRVLPGLADAHRAASCPPNPAQAAVPGWAECASSPRTSSPGAPGGQVVEDRARSPSANRPARRQPERWSTGGAQERGELDRAGHLRPDPGVPVAAASTSQAGRRRRSPGTSASAWVRGLGRGGRGPVPARVVRVVRVDDPRVARRGQAVPGDLGRARAGPGDDDQLLTGDPAPDPGARVAGRGGVAHRPEPDGLVVVDQPFLAQRRRMRLVRQRVQRAPARPRAGRRGRTRSPGAPWR